ncbi:MAG: DUF2793 domain-containing protein [Pseudomonadota bacterium]
MALADIAEPHDIAFDGVATVFDYPHRIADPFHLCVTRIGADGARDNFQLGVDYQIVDITGEGAKIRFLQGPPPAGDRAVVTRKTPRDQPTALSDVKRSPNRIIETGLNRLAMVLQDVGVIADLGLKIPPEEFDDPVTIGARADRAGFLQGFDADGQSAYTVRADDVYALASQRVKVLAIAGKLAELCAIYEQLNDIETVAAIAQDIVALADPECLYAIQCLAMHIGQVKFVADHIEPTYDVMRLAFSEGLFGGLAQAGGLYADEGPIDSKDIRARDEGLFPTPVPLELRDQGAVLDLDLFEPPADPAPGDRYIVAPTATGAWEGQEDAIAEWSETEPDIFAWVFEPAADCDFVAVADEPGAQYLFSRGAWRLWDGTPPVSHPPVQVRATDEGFIV